MPRRIKHAVFAGSVATLLAMQPTYAQVATSIEQAELAGLSPEKRAEVQARMAQGGQNVHEILMTILLNSIKLKHPASRIVALDFARGAAAVELTNGTMTVVPFDTRTLVIKS